MTKRDFEPESGAGNEGDGGENQRVNRALRQQWEDLRVILDSVPALIWYKDRDNRILRANRPAAEALGLSVSEMEGRSTYELYPEEAAQYHQDDLDVIRSGRSKLGIVEPLMTGAGEKRWVRTDKVPYFDGSGAVIGVIVFAVDITERVRAEEALRQARDGLEERVAERTRQLAAAVDDLRAEMAERQRADERIHQQQSQLAHLQRLRTVEGMAAQLAHEINQPLGAIVNFAGGLARWLRSDAVDMAAVQAATDQISLQALRAAGVVSRLRDFVRKDESRRESSDLGQVIGEAVRMIETDARRQGVTLRVNVAARLPRVDIDRVQIEQVVVNLLSNALEAMDLSADDHEIAVEATRRDDGDLEVRVRDTGAGLPVSDPQLLFEPFHTTKAEGLGMGLSISQSIITAHGGTLRGERNVGGRGATFTFTLPSARGE